MLLGEELTDVSLNDDLKRAYKKTPKQNNRDGKKVHDDIEEETMTYSKESRGSHFVDSRHSLNRDGED